MKQAELLPQTFTRSGSSIVPPTGQELARAGAEQAAAHADRVDPDAVRKWSDRAFFLFAAYARGHAEFTTEDVREHAQTLGLKSPPDARAWGAIAMRARGQKIVEKTGRYVAARDPRVHGNPIGVWRSLVAQA